MARTSTSSQQHTINGLHSPSTRPRPRTYSRARPSSYRQSLHTVAPTAKLHIHWLFRSNIPRRRGMPMPTDPNKRNFFGIGEILGVLANPSQTLRSLTESRRMLEETRQELAEARERAQLSPTHTFSSLPGFFDRPAELKAIERALQGEPSFTVLFGASSVGKTALLRQVLTRPTYHVLHFDLRIAGFADLASLYMSLSQQMEAFFTSIAEDPEMPGYEVFEKEAWAFKHDRLNVERRVASSTQLGETLAHTTMGEIKTSDVARLMELFQSSLLRYWNFQPNMSEVSSISRRKSVSHTESMTELASQQSKASRASWRMRLFGSMSRRKRAEKARRDSISADAMAEEKGKAKDHAPPMKKIPVFFMDEAHKLPALIRSVDAMKALLDAMLVLTKQDRLCHVIHATSDPFYQTWLRQLNVMQHCKIITVGDYPKADTRKYFRERILPLVPEHLRHGLDFERLYEAFGGKLAHWQDFVTDYVNANGRLEIKQSSHFLQAHALLNLHIIHSSQDPPAPPANTAEAATESAPSPQSTRDASQHAIHRLSPPPGSNNGFRIYSPLTANPHAAPAPPGDTAHNAPEFRADFTAIQLLKVMNRLAQPNARSIPYFILCREMGARAVDGMVKGRILDLRWTDPISKEGVDTRVTSMRFRESRFRDSTRLRESVRLQEGSSATAVNDYDVEDGEMVPMTDEEIYGAHDQMMDAQPPEEEEEVVGPKLVPITPIMRYAMREVVQEYYDDDGDSVSEYASLSEVEEY
ncbi:uncharacterized protein LAESUDRAFT_739719 [Laetiporus sulphureus 93-53]|uniref:AAA+ ATPase domain-containing protein n=1 Tax=Laetiporus sulphureus 93-53 TaxID=1314785 RepID=A0A165B3Y1_9APHY|nr:uncharacterized protein LAESUDRAFT_739719 [Laetiporus sulphureus 93-53]KZT00177.1 hypothetical protein LAESUDRAFT_739719 [Laetiporus sulphureus 93-53]